MTTSKLLCSVMVVTFAIHCTSLHADIGHVTINGETIPPTLFEGYSFMRMMREDRCPPLSDTYNRDIVIQRSLLAMEAKKQGLKIAQRDQILIDEFTQQLEYLGPNGDAREIAKATYLVHSYELGSYYNHFKVAVSHENILTEYKRLIDAKDPRFTNVVLVRHTYLNFDSDDDQVEAVDRLNNGATIDSINAEYEGDVVNVITNDAWFPASELKGYDGDGEELTSGSLISITEYDDSIGYLYISEVKYRYRIRPFARIGYTDSYAYKKIESNLRSTRNLERDRAMWEAADVREDGQPIKLSDSYPACPE